MADETASIEITAIVDSLLKGLRQAVSSLEELEVAAEDVSLPTAEEASARLQDLTRRAGKARSAMDQLRDGVGNLSGELKSAKAATAAFFGSIILGKLSRLGAEAVLAATNFGRLRRQLDAIQGVDSGEVLARIAARAEELGLELVGLEQSTVSFISSATRMGLTVSEATTAIEGYSEAALGAGKSNVELARALVQTEQALGKGKFELQDFKTILEVFPGALKAAAERLGVTNEQLLDFRNNGLAAKDVTLALAEALPELFGDTVQQNADDLIAEVNRLKNALEEAERAFGEAATPGATAFVEQMTEGTKEGKGFINFLGDLVAEIGVTGADLGTINRAIARSIERQRRAAEELEAASKRAAEAANERGEAEQDAARKAAKANEEAAAALRAYLQQLEELVTVAKQTYEDQAEDRRQALEDQLAVERDATEELIAEFEKAAEAYRVTTGDREEATREVAEELLEIEKEAAEKRIKILEEAEEKGREVSAEKRVEIVEEATKKLLEIEAGLQEQRSDIVKRGLEDLGKLEEKRVEQAEKNAQKIIELEAKIRDARRETAEAGRELFDEDISFDDPDVDNTTKRLAELREELAELQGALFRDPADFGRIDELRDKIFDITRNAQLAQQSYSDFSESLQQQSDENAAKINDFLSSSNFQTAFQSLSDAERAALLPMIENFETAAANANLNEQRVGELETALRDLGLVGESAAGGIAEKLRKLSEAPTGAVAKLEQLRQKQQELAGASEQAAAPLERIDKAVQGIAARGEEAGKAAANIGAGFAENEGAITNAGNALAKVSEATPGLASDLDAIAKKLPELLEAVKTANDEGTIKSLATDIKDLATQTAAAKKGFEPIVAGIKAILEAAEKAGQVTKLKDALVELSKTSEALGKVATSLGDVAGKLKDIVTQGGRVEGAMGKARTALENFKTFIDDTAIPAIGRLNDALGTIITKLGEVESAFFDLRTTANETFDEIVSGAARAGAAVQRLRGEIQGAKDDGDDAFDADLGPATSPAAAPAAGAPLAGPVGPVQPGSQAGQLPPPP